MIKWKGAKRPKYYTVEQVDERIEAYFKECADEDIYPTVSGLAYEMDICRDTLLRYKKLDESEELSYISDVEVRKKISNSIKRAYKFIEEGYEDKLVNGKTQAIGTIFALKNNFRWVDKTETVVEQKTISIGFDEEE